MIDDELRNAMTETYFNGGVTLTQVIELGPEWPTISKFAEFSNRYHGVPFRALYGFGGLEFVFSYEADFENIGISGQHLAACMDGETDAIRSVCRAILESIDATRERVQGGQAHLVSRGVVLSQTAAKAFVLAALDARERYQFSETIPELYFLLAQILFPGEPETEQARKSADLKLWVSFLAWVSHSKHGEYPSFRKLARLIGVAPSTISRLFSGREDLEKCAQKYALFNKDARDHPLLESIYSEL